VELLPARTSERIQQRKGENLVAWSTLTTPWRLKLVKLAKMGLAIL
jgi:hypothetical protein